MKDIGSRVKNIYALEVEDACTTLRRKEKNRDMVVEREHVRPLNIQTQKESQQVVEQP